MTLSQPLWLLLLPLLGLLLYFHRQRRAYRTQEVGALHLWQRLAAQQAPTSVRRLPRFSLALLLQALVLLLLLLALARPSLGSLGAQTHTVLLLDASRASTATQGGGTRFAAERARALRLLAPETSVLLVGDRTRALTLRAPVPAARLALGDALPDDGAADWAQAAATLEALARPGERLRVVALVSFGSGGAAQTALQTFRPQIERFGQAAPNTALTRASLGRTAAGAARLSGAARAFGGLPRHTRLTVTLAGREVARPVLALTPGHETRFQVTLPPGAAGTLSLQLDDDQLNADNAASFVILPAPAILRAAVVGPDDELRRAVLRALSAVDGVRAAPVRQRPRPGEADLQVVTDPALAARAPTATGVPTLWLTGRSAAAVSGGSGAVTATWQPHPLTAGGGWADLRASPLSLPAWTGAAALVAGPAGPLMEVRGNEVRATFDVAASGWLRSPGFPAFMLSLVRWAAPDTGQTLPAPCTVGVPCALNRSATVLRSPAGLNQPVSGSFVPLRAGLYQLGGQAGGQLGGRTVAVNRLAGPDADLSVVDPAPATPPFTAPLPLWSALMGLALLVVLLEAALAWRGARPSERRRALLGVLPAALLLAALLDLPLPFPGQQRPAVVLAPRPAGSGTTSSAARPLTAPGRSGVGDVPTLYPGPDLAEALSLGAAAVPAGGHLIVRRGAGQRWAASPALESVLTDLRGRGMVVDVAGLPSPALQLSAPRQVGLGQTAELSAAIVLPQQTQVQLTLQLAGRRLYSGQRRLGAGTQRINFPVTATAAGEQVYTLTLTARDPSSTVARPVQTQAEPSLSASVVLTVRPADRVALIGQPAETAPLAQALRVQGRNVQELTPPDAPAQLDALRQYAGVALINVPARELNAERRAALSRYVAGGGQLLISGGARSFGPGGYFGTVLETLSPLSSRVIQDAPRVALGLLLDKSGSMNEAVGNGYSKLDLIKAAGIAAAELLHPQSEVAVIAFDTTPKIVVPLQTASRMPELRAAVGRVEAEGGTQVMRALTAGLKELIVAPEASKHLILLTDGIDGGIFSAETYGELVGRIRASGITLSTVSVGSGMHVPLMRALAEKGGGRFAQTDDWRDVPGLLASDTLSQGQSSVQVGPQAVQWLPAAALPPGTVPGALGGYVRTTLKPQATLLAQTAGGQPLAARWQAGQGTVTALAGGLGGWASSWTALPGFPALLSGWLRPDALEDAAQVNAAQRLTLRQAGSRLLVSAPRQGDELTAPATVTGPQGNVPLTLTARGDQLVGTLVLDTLPVDTLPLAESADRTGLYRVSWAGQTATLALAFSAADPLDAARLQTGGRQSGEVVLPARSLRWERRSVWPVWACLGLLLFLALLGRRYLRPTARARPGQPETQPL